MYIHVHEDTADLKKLYRNHLIKKHKLKRQHRFIHQEQTSVHTRWKDFKNNRKLIHATTIGNQEIYVDG